MRSPMTLKEMQSLSGKLAALSKFLARSIERSLPFFETLKNIMKDNKNEYCPQRDIVRIFGGVDGISKRGAISRKGRETKADTIYQPIRQVMEKFESSGKLAKYSVELGAYNITYMPRNAVKGQVLADFLTETPIGEGQEVCNTAAGTVGKGEWTLFMDGASNGKASFKADQRGIRDSQRKHDPVLGKAKEQIKAFKKFTIQNIPWNQNQKADEIAAIVEEEGDNWMTPIMKCLKDEICPEDPNKARSLRMKINQFELSKIIVTDNGIQLVNDPFKSWEIGAELGGSVPHPRSIPEQILQAGNDGRPGSAKEFVTRSYQDVITPESDSLKKNPNTSQGCPGRTCPTSLAGAVEYYRYLMRMTKKAYWCISQGSPDHLDVLSEACRRAS
ncbi:hypothetical protein Tco_0865129 [Tanacetum coccineum]